MRWGRRGWEVNLASLVVEQPLVRVRLQAIGTAAFLWVEELARQIIHDLPIPVGGEYVPKAGLRDIPNMECLVLLVEQESAWRNQSVA